MSLKVILIGDTASGKSKLLTRYLKNEYISYTSSTHGLSLYNYRYKTNKKHPLQKDNEIEIHFYDTAGQERFNHIHPSYYHGAHACIMVFDLGRKTTYKHLENWYDELREFRPTIPIVVIANKIDEYPDMTTKSFLFAKDKSFYFTSAKYTLYSYRDGTNVVAAFEKAIDLGLEYILQVHNDEKDDLLELLNDPQLFK